MLRYGRDRSQIFGAISRTILWLVILGFGLGAALREIEGYSYAQYILPGVITLNVLFSSLQCAISLVWDREVGLLRSVIVSPAPMLSVTLGKLFGGATIAFGFSRSMPLSLACLALLGAADMFSVYVRQSLIQLYTPDEMRGRVGAVSSLFVSASNELGETESGFLGAIIGPVPAVIAGGIGAIAVVFLWSWWFPELRLAKSFDAPDLRPSQPEEPA